MLGRVDRETGELHLAPRQRVHEAIQGAVKAGFLAEGSNASCLIVPGHAVSKTNGDVDEPCTRHRAPKAERPTLRAVS